MNWQEGGSGLFLETSEKRNVKRLNRQGTQQQDNAFCFAVLVFFSLALFSYFSSRRHRYLQLLPSAICRSYAWSPAQCKQTAGARLERRGGSVSTESHLLISLTQTKTHPDSGRGWCSNPFINKDGDQRQHQHRHFQTHSLCVCVHVGSENATFGWPPRFVFPCGDLALDPGFF